MSHGPWIDQDGWSDSVNLSKPLSTAGTPNRSNFVNDWLTLQVRGNDAVTPGGYGPGGHYGTRYHNAYDLGVDDGTGQPDGEGHYVAVWNAAVAAAPAAEPSDPLVDPPNFTSAPFWDLRAFVAAGPYSHPARTTKWWEDQCQVQVEVLTLGFRIVVDEDPDLIDWPDGAIDVEYEGPVVISDVSVTVAGTDGQNTPNDQAASDPDDDRIYTGMGTVRLVPGAATEDDYYIPDTLGATTDTDTVTDIYGGDVSQDPLDFTTPEAFLTVIPNMYGDPAPEIPGLLGDHYVYYFVFGKMVFTIAATIVRPRYRWVFEGGFIPPDPVRRMWPRPASAEGPARGRDYPPPITQQSGRRFGAGAPV